MPTHRDRTGPCGVVGVKLDLSVLFKQLEVFSGLRYAERCPPPGLFYLVACDLEEPALFS